MTEEPTPVDDPRPLSPKALVPLIVVGAFGGAALRYGIGLEAPGLAGTLGVNVAGSLLLGLLLESSTGLGRPERAVRLLLGTGFLSSLTTFSTFALDAATAPPAVAGGYVLATYGLGLAGVLVGRTLARTAGGPFP